MTELPTETDERLRDLLAHRLQDREPVALQEQATEEVRLASVILGVTELGLGAGVGGLHEYSDWQAAPCLLLTRRAASLRRHAGQWALPGGRLDAGESAESAALRELREEVGVAVTPGALLGRLDDYRTDSGFIIRPLVAWLGPARELKLDPTEVASAHRIPFSELARADAPLLSAIEDSEHPVLRMPVGDDSIATPTAAMLYQFREWCLFDRDTSVQHFAQPVFARS